MSLDENYQQFTLGKIPKAEFIKKNYRESYQVLFDLSVYLEKTDIKSIEIKDQIVVMTYRKNDMKLICESSEYRTAPLETITFLKYEDEEVSVFHKLLKGKKLFFDIGGNIGFYAVFSAVEYPTLKVEAFEPVPKMFQTLSRNIEINQLQSRVQINNFGFSDKDGTVLFFVYPFGGTNASMANVSEAKDAKEVTSKVLRMDNYVRETGKVPDIIKCDVEGAEKLVMMGGLETIKASKPVLFFELLRKWSAKFNYHPNEIFATMREIGYEVYVPSCGKLKAFSLMDEATIENNFFFLHKQAHAQSISELVTP
jgi:FkbM family methyltransferase